MHTNAQYYNGQVRIDSADRSFLFQVTDIVPQFHSRHFYYWFKSGHIYQTEGSFYGKLLHGYYKVVDKDRHLLEQGRFKLGEKTGLWRTWYENGQLKSLAKKRFLDGAQHIETYDENGKLLKRGYEKDGLFTGLQVELVQDSSVVVRYKKGIRQPAKTVRNQ
ncbi:hypothetical protein A8C56_02700 [Niabella ginsenosidivorans]|uniref:Membrane-binding protein n=2 Tax=Niabella ginsenosidivorans TaxID=1176587 RepID=A0A1A9HXR2_9BACT|nr:hypothetical protein A8C56_02700 [Niabella ginsenosidivorans]